MNRSTGVNAGQIIGTMNGLQVVGLDIAKHVFQIHTVHMGTGEINNLQIRRAAVTEYFANKSPCLRTRMGRVPRVECAHPLVELSMVSGVGQPAAYAVLVLDEHVRPRLADPAVRARVEAELTRLLHDVNEPLASHEHLQMLVVAREPWSMEAGTLTPTMKIKRARIEASVADAVDGWYASGASVVWA